MLAYRAVRIKDAIRSGMVLTGGGAQIKNITNLANYVTGMEARTACPTGYTIDETSVDGAKTTAASTAVGLLIHGFQMMENEAISCENSVIEFPAEVEEDQAESEVAAPAETRKARLSRWGRRKEKEAPRAEEDNATEDKRNGKSKSGGLLGGFLNGANLFSNNFSDEA